MRPLRYSINVTLDGCCHHEAGLPPDEESMRYWTAAMERADALLFGRVTYEMMESAWRQPATGTWPEWMGEWEIPFAETIDRAKKYVVSSTLSGVDWNAELVRGDLGQAVQRLKQEPGEGLFVGGVTLPLALADLGLIDEYEFLVQPVLAGHGPTLLAGLRERIQLELVDRHEFRSGAVALRYEPRRSGGHWRCQAPISTALGARRRRSRRRWVGRPRQDSNLRTRLRRPLAPPGAHQHSSWVLDDGVAVVAVVGRPRQDSNLRTRLRRPMLYPLSYEGVGCAPTAAGRSAIAARCRGRH